MFGFSEDQIAQFGLTFGVSAFMLYMVFIIFQLARESKAGKFGTFVLFLALGFGLIHGMGFANAIRFMLAREQSLGWSLLGFNLGLEFGQIFVVLLVLSLTWLATQRLAVKRTWWVYGVSGLVFAIALQMAFERNPF